MSYSRYSRRSERFDSDQLRDYARARREKYPNTYDDTYPDPESKDDYELYCSDRHEADRAIAAYDDEYEKVAGPRDEVPRDSLDSSQHSVLVGPAAAAASATLGHATNRDNYMLKHPYGYYTRGHREHHDTFIDRAFDEANEYREAYDDHYRGAGGSLGMKPMRSRSTRTYLDEEGDSYRAYLDKYDDYDDEKPGRYSSSKFDDYDDQDLGEYDFSRGRRRYSSSPDAGPSSRSLNLSRGRSTGRLMGSFSTSTRDTISSRSPRHRTRGYGYGDYDD